MAAGAKSVNGARSPRHKSWRAGFGVPEDDAHTPPRAPPVTFGNADDEESVSDEAAGLVAGPGTKKRHLQPAGEEPGDFDKRAEYEAAGLVPSRPPGFYGTPVLKLSMASVAAGVTLVILFSVLGSAVLVTAMGYELTVRGPGGPRGQESSGEQTDAEAAALRQQLAEAYAVEERKGGAGAAGAAGAGAGGLGGAPLGGGGAAGGHDQAAGEVEGETKRKEGEAPFEEEEEDPGRGERPAGGGFRQFPPRDEEPGRAERPTGGFRQFPRDRGEDEEPGRAERPTGGFRQFPRDRGEAAAPAPSPLEAALLRGAGAGRGRSPEEREQRIAEFRKRAAERLEQMRKGNPERFEQRQRSRMGARSPPPGDGRSWQAPEGGHRHEGPWPTESRSRQAPEGGFRQDGDAPPSDFRNWREWRQKHGNPNDGEPNLYQKEQEDPGGKRRRRLSSAVVVAGGCSLSHWDCAETGKMVPCPALPQPDKAAILQRAALGERVHSTRRPPPLGPGKEPPLHLFIMAGAKTGGSALTGLVLTSPEASGLCGEPLCEGVHALQRAGLFDWSKRWEAGGAVDWQSALSIWEKQWEPSKAVWVEKGQDWHIPNRIDELVSHFRSTGKRVGFLFLTRSACFETEKPLRSESRCTADRNRLLFNAMEVVGRANFSWHVVQYEEMIRDPYAAARGILDAFPSLGSLQPGASGLAENVRKFYGENSTAGKLLRASLTEYITKLDGGGRGGDGGLERRREKRLLPAAVHESAARSSACVGYRLDLD